MSLAFVKDFGDVGTVQALSLIDWTVDLFIWGILFFFFWGKGTWKVRLALWATGFFEIVPFLGALPMWTSCVIYCYHQDSKRLKEIKNNEIK